MNTVSLSPLRATSGSRRACRRSGSIDAPLFFQTIRITMVASKPHRTRRQVPPAISSGIDAAMRAQFGASEDDQ